MNYYSQITQKEKLLLNAIIEYTLPTQIATLQSLIQIPSVKENPIKDCPFGLPLRQALEFILLHANGIGFDTINYDGYMGVIEAGSGSETLGILAHIDVVPPGEGWTVNPFLGECLEGKIYGRGAIDDKGPALSAIYALNAVVAAKIPLNKKVQILLGCDEESGWGCIEYYKKQAPLPSMAFSPDGEYPLINSEKAILHLTFLRRGKSAVTINGGEKANVVPGYAKAIVPGLHKNVPHISGYTIAFTHEGGNTIIEATGLSAHASTPMLGKNALHALLNVLSRLTLLDDCDNAIKLLASLVSFDNHGESFGIDTQDESGRLTINLGILNWDENKASITFDVRLPHCLSHETATQAIARALAPASFELFSSSVTPGHMAQRDSQLVQTLLNVYQAQTGIMEPEPVAIGGGTYARAIKNAVGFGPLWPGQKSLAHMPDEYIEIEDLLKNTRMYADAIIALTR